jgi:GNAT superfamily N-acetyltransferase
LEPSGALQTLLNNTDHGMSPLEAVIAPRIEFQGKVVHGDDLTRRVPRRRRLTLWAADLRGASPPPAPAAPSVVEVDRALVPMVEVAMGDERPLVRLRLERGCRCFAARIGDGIAGYGWLSIGPEWIGELGLEIRPAHGEAYLWNCVTLPEYRNRGYYRALLLHVVAVAAQEGLSRLWIGSVDGAAESAVVGAGFRPILNFRSVTALGWRWIRARGAAGADPGTIAAALSSLDGTGFRRARNRIH